MRDGGKIAAGLAVFFAAALFPIWSNLFAGKPVPPEPKIVTKEKQCIEPKQTMRDTHMEILNAWRQRVVREGQRTTRTAAGKTVNMSLTGTCLSCHSNKKEFCDTCHNYMAVSPYCFDCHVEPKEKA
jgi:hypothetical protein